MKAKDVSLKSIVFAIVWVALMSLVKAFVPVFFEGKQVGISMMEIFGAGAFFVIACSPVYRSIWLDKKLGLKAEEVNPTEKAKDEPLEELKCVLGG